MTAHPGVLSMDTLHSSCRICSSVVASTVPLNDLPDSSGSSSLADMLRYCVNLEINEYDGLPYQCCEQCKADLVIAYKLVIRCHQSDAKFRGLLMETKTDAGDSLMESDELPNLVDSLIKTEVSEDMLTDECVYAEPLQPEVDIKPVVKKEKRRVVSEDSESDDDDDEDYDRDPDFKQESDDEEKETISSKKPEPKRGRRRANKEIKRCCRCKEKLSTMEEVLKHSQTVHANTKVTDPARMEARPYECDVCFKRYTTEKALALHKEQLYVENEFKCDQCEEDFKSKNLLDQHIESHAREMIQPYCNRKGQLPRCCACYEQFETDELLKAHAAEVHQPESLTADDKDNQFACDVCFRRYKSLRILRDHQLKAYRVQQFQCCTCGRIFRDKTAMADHERSHDEGKSFVCPICAKTFVMKDSFRKHVRAHSIAADRYKCEVCGRGFKTNSNLKNHLITHNPTHRPLQCTLCPSSFAWKTCLQAHMKLHTGEKNFKCDQCDAAYAFSTDLKRHIMAHQGIKPFVCTICGRGYPRKDYLRKHMANHMTQA